MNILLIIIVIIGTIMGVSTLKNTETEEINVGYILGVYIGALLWPVSIPVVLIIDRHK